MKNPLFYIVIMLGLALASCGDKAGQPAAGNDMNKAESLKEQMRQERVDFHQRMYDQALKNSDFYTQIVALNALMLDDSTGHAMYNDSLSKLYTLVGLSKAASGLVDKTLNSDPESESALNLKMELAMRQGNAPEAVNTLRKLYEKTGDVKYLFTIVEINLQQQKIGEVEKMLKQIENDPKHADGKVEFTNPQSGQQQMIPVKAAVPYVRAMIAYSQQKISETELQLKRSLKADPSFGVAKQLLGEIEAARKGLR